MNIQDVHTYFNKQNQRAMVIEEVVALVAYLLVDEGREEITASDLMEAATRTGYYAVNWSVLYNALKFCVRNRLVSSGNVRKRMGADGTEMPGRPEKTYRISMTEEGVKELQSLSGYWRQMIGHGDTPKKHLDRFVSQHDKARVLTVSLVDLATG